MEQEKFSLDGFDIISTDEEEWIKWDTPGKSLSGWITEFTIDTFQDRQTKVCKMVIDVENDQRLPHTKNVKFIISLDLEKKLDKVKTTILERYSDYRIYIKLDEVRTNTDNTKRYKVFTVAVKKEPMPSIDYDDIQF